MPAKSIKTKKELSVNQRWILFIAALVYIYVVTTLSSFLLLSIGIEKGESSGARREVVKTVKLPASEEEFNPLKAYNVVLLGYGGAGHSGGGLADGLLVAHINPEIKKVVLISMPRDLWVELPMRSDLKEYHKINEAFAIGNDDKRYGLKQPRYRGVHGGGEMTKYAVGEVLDMPVEYYLSIDFDRLKQLIDTLGGVDVDVPVTFDDHFYPVKGLEAESCGKSPEEIADLTNRLSGFQLEKQFECRYEHIHFDKGTSHMGGEVALKFVRSRHSDQHGGDFARHVRQQALLLGIKDKLLSLYGISKATQAYEQLVGMIGADVDRDVLLNMLSVNPIPSEYTVTKVTLSESGLLQSSKSSGGQFILVPEDGIGEWGGIQSYVKERIQ